MKILHIGQLIGGLDVYIRNTITYIDGQKFEPIIVCGKDDQFQPITKNGRDVKCYKVRLYRKVNPWNDILCLIQIIRILRQEKPEIIHCHSAKGGFIGRFAGFLTRTKTFYTPHAFSFLSTNNKVKRFIYFSFEKIAVLNSYLLACSESERMIAIDTNMYKKEKTFAWSNSVPDASIDVVKSSVINCPYIVYIGRPSFQKNPFFLIDVAEQVCKRNPEIKFYLLGVGYFSPDLDALKQEILAHDLQDKLVLVEWLPQRKSLEIVKGALFYLSVSKYEGLPLSVIEAMSLGKAIVASDVLGNKDCVKHNENGYLLPLEVDSFVSHIDALTQDEKLCEQFGLASRNMFMDQFNIATRIHALEKIYES